LIFTCCHPALPQSTQVALTLREVCGLTTEEIARGLRTAPATVAQRIVRGKAKIRAAGIPYYVPSAADLPERLASVLQVTYLVFNEGYAAMMLPPAESKCRTASLDARMRPRTFRSKCLCVLR
jgi:RNA polymerase sigma-70 factor (ECF subfamily)